MKKLVWLVLAFCSLLLVACSGGQNQSGKLKVMTTFYPVYEFTKQVIGDEGDVELLIGSGSEPHDFELSAKGRAKIQESDVFVYENENMETWVPQLLQSMDGKKTKVVKATENMLLLPGGEEEHDHEGGEEHHHDYDPHVWLSPQRAIKMVETIRDQLVKQYPDKKDSFTANADAYIAKLKKLDDSYTKSLSAAKQKNFVTQHAAFRYLALDYGLNQVSISGLSPDSEPSATRLSELTEYIKKNDIKVIYFEENASKSLSKTLSAETGVDLAVLNPLESLTDEQMKDGEDYISIMGANLKSLELTTTQAGKEIAPEEEEDTKTAEEYKAYYTTGYKTDVERIVITDKTMTFYKNGEEKKFEYRYAGKHTLTYTKGNRGVRYLFEATDPNAGEFKYVQFSDHQIAPNKAAHFHIFFGGESQEALYNELENWPTYYPSDLTGFEIAQEMLAH